jgi:hypothetical protein
MYKPKAPAGDCLYYIAWRGTILTLRHQWLPFISTSKHALRECGEKVTSIYSRDRLLGLVLLTLVGMRRGLEIEKA